MKFAIKYPNQKVEDPANEEGLIVGKNEEPCRICGESTRFVEICSEGHFCSDECLDKFWDWCNEHCQPCMAEDFMEVEEMKPEIGKVVLVEPGKPARVVDMELSLENMQKTVGGTIQAIYPWSDEVALVCNDEGKILELPPNRALSYSNGTVYDIVCGTFFICGLTEDNFGGLSDELAEKYVRKFSNHEIFTRDHEGKLLIVEFQTPEE